MGNYKDIQINIGDDILFIERYPEEMYSIGRVTNKLDDSILFVEKKHDQFTKNRMVSIYDVESIIVKTKEPLQE